MLIVPVQAIPAQSLNVTLNGQACLLTLRQNDSVPNFDSALYLSVAWSSATVPSGQLNGILCLNAVRIFRNLYWGFLGDFAFFDTAPDPVYGPQAPYYTGLGSRFILAYLETTDLDGLG